MSIPKQIRLAIAAIVVSGCLAETQHPAPPSVSVGQVSPAATCAELGQLRASAYYGFVYDADAAIAKLRRQAAEKGGNYLRIDQLARPRRSGVVIATAFHCPG